MNVLLNFISERWLLSFCIVEKVPDVNAIQVTAGYSFALRLNHFQPEPSIHLFCTSFLPAASCLLGKPHTHIV